MMLAPTPDTPGPIGKHTTFLAEGLTTLNCSVIRLPWGRSANLAELSAVRERMTQILTALSRALKQRPDVAVVKTAHDWKTLFRDVPLLICLRILGVPCIAQFHGSQADRLVGPRWNPFIAASRLLVHFCIGIFTLSNDETARWRHLVGRIPVVTVKNPYRPRNITFAHAVGGRFHVAFLGRIIEEKGVLDVVMAMRELPRDSYDITFIGDGDALGRARSLSAQHGIAASFTGRLAQEDAFNRLGENDCMVLPTYWGEGFPTVLLEAADAGVPIVATSHRGAADHLCDRVNALLVPAKNPSALAEAVRVISSDGELRRRLIAGARELLPTFAPLAVSDEYLAAIRTCLHASESH